MVLLKAKVYLKPCWWRSIRGGGDTAARGCEAGGQSSADLAGTCHVDGGAVRGGGHVVAVGHHFDQDVLRLQVVDEAGDVRLFDRSRRFF